METELQHTEEYHERTGGNLLKDILKAELDAEERIVFRNHDWVAYVPASSCTLAAGGSRGTRPGRSAQHRPAR
jgi:galactose-1-phosphate uridylyltransferase